MKHCHQKYPLTPFRVFFHSKTCCPAFNSYKEWKSTLLHLESVTLSVSVNPVTHQYTSLESHLTQKHASVTWSRVRPSDLFETPARNQNISTNLISSPQNFSKEVMKNMKCLTACQIFHTKEEISPWRMYHRIIVYNIPLALSTDSTKK